MFDEFIENEKDNMLYALKNLIGFKSVSIENDNPQIPFGDECRKALDYTLNLAKSLGFRTKNLDNYCGYIEFGEGEELLGIIGHLDVVPANINDGWSTSPFEMTIKDNKVFGRGTIDDKGPVIASLFAMKAVLESGKKLNKRVRLILGVNEEKDWKCINHYKEIREEIPSIGFSPDADFPCIYAEKGILSIRIKHKFSIKDIEILEINCNQNALNVVPKYCSITLKCKNKINFQKTDKISIENIDDETIKIIATGISAHAAHPDLGENAITNLISYLNSYLDKSFFKNKFNLIHELSKLGLFDITSPKFLSDKPIKDESGILTSNVGFMDYKNGEIEIGLNLRVPVNTSLNFIKEKYLSLKNTFPEISINFTSSQEPLYVSKDSFLVKTLTDIFNKKTGLNEEPIAIGGGTYARAFPNCVAFGANFPGKKDMCHQVDEFIDMDCLMQSAKIYAETIYELGK